MGAAAGLIAARGTLPPRSDRGGLLRRWFEKTGRSITCHVDYIMFQGWSIASFDMRRPTPIERETVQLINDVTMKADARGTMEGGTRDRMIDGTRSWMSGGGGAPCVLERCYERVMGTLCWQTTLPVRVLREDHGMARLLQLRGLDLDTARHGSLGAVKRVDLPSASSCLGWLSREWTQPRFARPDTLPYAYVSPDTIVRPRCLSGRRCRDKYMVIQFPQPPQPLLGLSQAPCLP